MAKFRPLGRRTAEAGGSRAARQPNSRPSSEQGFNGQLLRRSSLRPLQSIRFNICSCIFWAHFGGRRANWR